MNYALVSKRKIGKLINEDIVNDWCDPLFTLSALRNFCAQMDVTGAQISVDSSMLEAAVWDVLNVTAPRRLVVQEPLKVTIANFPHEKAIDIEVPNFLSNPEKGTHRIVLGRVKYIERSDFKLTLVQSVSLRHTGLVISVSEIKKDSDWLELSPVGWGPKPMCRSCDDRLKGLR